jgi:hypothetical protein
MMHWFLSKIVFRVEHSASAKRMFDEQYRLIHAENENGAFNKALEIGLKEEESFPDSKHRTVSWKFIGIVSLNRLPELTDSMELDSRSEEPENETDYEELVKEKHRVMQLHLEAKPGKHLV